MTGGTGFLGSALRRRLEAEGHSITVLSRSKDGVVGSTTFVRSLEDLGPHDAVINLAGETVAGFWTKKKKQAIYDSRIDTTRELVEWMDKQPVKPSVFLSSSAVGIYGDRGAEELTEKSDLAGPEDFLAKVCRDWEQAAMTAAWKGTRTVLLRTGHPLDPSGGYLGTVLPMMRRFPIVILGSRDAYLPWIALSDWVELVIWALGEESVSGPLNMSAPNPATQEEFTQAAAAYLKKRIWGRVPKWAIRLGTGEFGSAITTSERAIPAKARDGGFRFGCMRIDEYFAGL
jgi:uncharacterized protein (TIGR01777 family)